MDKLPKVIVILGVTASGKTALSLKLAKKFKGEIISADSRQIYKEFNIGTAKPAGHWLIAEGERKFIAGGLPHYLMDTVDPKEDFNLIHYKKLATEKINELGQKGKLPFLVGGTALYLKTLLENWTIPAVEPNLALRRRLENKNVSDLLDELKKKDPEAVAITGYSNKRRIIRALEVIYQTGRKFSEQRKAGRPLFDALKIGLKTTTPELTQRITRRTDEMIKDGLVKEVQELAKKYSWDLVPMQSIDYQEFKDYFEGKKSLSETVKEINRHHMAYAKRQMTWFKKDKTIHWISSEEEAENLTESFLQN
ncbi:MAG: tRNA (adenosine(37)-N6)-dimethylallyltransferase MiaA [Candidatus Sungbacteria bacterium]|uniref:tRNA dimethylallyltransferase n=1 Tax=Candidatus Sungiibacteriota bacterium TaxID=2750080 RepID=A0A931YDY0_9BACT|nr:tRNA (adenosine(37)-N6)-dimethylallyltransferase MiaA [Candidatus Sungbacteria bacterium]MBI2466178.1 tRNA (adenosine(37)-N6)-dimethylallyltransferase MiaA [Candidatus Sungbacteria bacterium]